MATSRKPKTADKIEAPPSSIAAADATCPCRALVDLPDHGVCSGQLLQADAATVASLAAAGLVDTHPDAIAACAPASPPASAATP